MYPQTWEEFCKEYPLTDNDYFIGAGCGLTLIHKHGKQCNLERDVFYDRNLCISKEECASFIALMQLRQLYKAWIDIWEKNHKIKLVFHWNGDQEYPCIVQDTFLHGIVIMFLSTPRVFCFPDGIMASDFLEYFKDLFEIAKPLL